MVAKRALFKGPATPAKNAKRLKSLETTVYRRNFGEVKTITNLLASTQVTNGNLDVRILTGIGTGANQGQRVGNEIRVRDILISGHKGNGDVSVYLIQSRTGEAPDLSNFTSTIAGHLTQGTAQEHFNVVASDIGPRVQGMDNNARFYLRKRWSIPMKVSFTGPTATEVSSNQLYLVAINRSGSNQNIQWSYTMHYID